MFVCLSLSGRFRSAAMTAWSWPAIWLSLPLSPSLCVCLSFSLSLSLGGSDRPLWLQGRNCTRRTLEMFVYAEKKEWHTAIEKRRRIMESVPHIIIFHGSLPPTKPQTDTSYHRHEGSLDRLQPLLLLLLLLTRGASRVYREPGMWIIIGWVFNERRKQVMSDTNFPKYWL